MQNYEKPSIDLEKIKVEEILTGSDVQTYELRDVELDATFLG